MAIPPIDKKQHTKPQQKLNWSLSSTTFKTRLAKQARSNYLHRSVDVVSVRILSVEIINPGMDSRVELQFQFDLFEQSGKGSRMSHLKLFRSERADVNRSVSLDDSEPVILSFQQLVRSKKSDRLNEGLDDLVLRARKLNDNKRCPRCDHPVVVPLELDDTRLGKGRRPIPCTGTLVGFHCNGCHSEWPA